MSLSSKALLDTTGIRIPQDAFVIIIRTEWNAHVVDLLEEGCRKVLDMHNIAYSVITVPGAFEIGYAINQYAKHASRKASAFIALGCVIKGDTPHFDYVCRAVTDYAIQLNLSIDAPVIFGVITVLDQVQADERTGGRQGHKGEEAAITAIKMISFRSELT